ncbi:SDR family NAD(P)-dependent oxidoreductase [Cohnella sp. 56]|uniref:SDR family NAD(P)-dependent oxidoreductase n=1 Tax=Cohnella sp. 56 TaxID=3113722 RepID=UPI0030E9349E
MIRTERDLENRTILLSGGTSGVGRATALELARRGATIVILSRSEDNGRQTLEDIAGQTGNGKGECLVADLSLQSSVRRACAAFKQRYDRLDVLANLGGAIYWEKQITEEGIERMFAVNVLSHFLLTQQLQDMLKESPAARVITVGGDPRFLNNPRIDFGDIQSMNRFSGKRATMQAMYARILFGFELADRLEGTGVSSVVFHPGWVKSRLNRHSPWYLRMLSPMMNALAARDCKAGVYAASAAGIDGLNGIFIDDKLKLLPIKENFDKDAGPRLWQACQDLMTM